MEIKKIDNYCELIFENEKFILDPPSPKPIEGSAIILTDISLNLNKDKIFNSPGEYNIGNVNFFGFLEKNSVSYLFKNEEGGLLYFTKDLSEETIKKLKINKFVVDAIFSPKLSEEVFSKLKPKIIITFEDINLPKHSFKKEKGEKFKINLKKVENIIYILK